MCRLEGDWIETISHELVPKHEILSAEEKERVLRVFEAQLGHLPRMLISDPVAKMIGAKVDDVVRITRISHTAGESVYYRAVVEK